LVGRGGTQGWRSQNKGIQSLIQILYKHEEFKVKIDNLAENLGPYVRAFREDYAQGKVVLVDPKKKQ
jgi:hypothetical protein